MSNQCSIDECAIDHSVRGYFGQHYMPESRRSVYNTWRHMIDRCSNPSNKDFVNYGHRGISVYAEWAESFDSFYTYIGDRPSSSHSLDRVDNDGNYQPGNVRWATKSQQQMNRRTFKNNKSGIKGVTFNKANSKYEVRYRGKYIGKFLTMHEAAKVIKQCYTT